MRKTKLSDTRMYKQLLHERTQRRTAKQWAMTDTHRQDMLRNGRETFEKKWSVAVGYVCVCVCVCGWVGGWVGRGCLRRISCAPGLSSPPLLPPPPLSSTTPNQLSVALRHSGGWPLARIDLLLCSPRLVQLWGAELAYPPKKIFHAHEREGEVGRERGKGDCYYQTVTTVN